MSMKEEVLVVGAGISGLTVALALARQGVRVRVSEKRASLEDLVSERPSINLTLGARGMEALRELDLDGQVAGLGLKVKSRHIHHLSGRSIVQPYGSADESILSLRRNDLARLLVHEVLSTERISIQLGERLVRAEPDGTASVQRSGATEEQEIHAEFVIGADGLNSRVRRAVCDAVAMPGADAESTGTKWIELRVSEPWSDSVVDAVDVWPRHPFMLIAFPNRDAVKTVLLFAPEGKGFPCYEELRQIAPELQVTQEEYESSLRRQDEVRVVKCPVWHAGRLCLVGDAAHAMPPYLGQGANAALSDSRELMAQLSGSPAWEEVGRRFEAVRRPEMECLARLTDEHFSELSQNMGDWSASLRRDLRMLLGKYFPGKFQPIYNRVTFSVGSLQTAEREHAAEESQLTALLEELFEITGTVKE